MKIISRQARSSLSRRDWLRSTAVLPLVLLADRVDALGRSGSKVIARGGRTPRRAAMREIPAAQKFLIADDRAGAPDPKGWYYHVLNVVDTPEGLVCMYRKTDSHTAVISEITVCRSTDKGRTWRDHRTVSRSDVWTTGGLWVAPQMSRLKDGRLVIIADFGKRTAGQDWAMLSQWQKPDRGMSNHLFWSLDNGRTWSAPQRIDDIGGEPGFIAELFDGTLIYTRTESLSTSAIWNPPAPWGGIYYRNVAVFSDDGGRTWDRKVTISDEPLQGDCETGVVEIARRHLLAVTRVGLGSGQFGQPSRFIYSRDNGRTWNDKRLSPIYGHRPIVRRLRSGNFLVTYRNHWGTPATYALVFSRDEELPYQPASFIWDESRCRLESGAMVLETLEGREAGAIFALYPAQAPDSRVEIEAELKVERAARHGCAISAGCVVRLLPDRVELADRPAQGFALDATVFRKYRIIRENGSIKVFVDGELRLDQPTQDIETRYVHFGNRLVPGWFGATENPPGLRNMPPPPPPILQNEGLSHWRLVRAKVDNRNDHSIEWRWTAVDGFPDQFRRDRIVCLDRNASFAPGNSGYSGWAEMSDGTIVICDYTPGSPASQIPFARAYVTSEEELRWRELLTSRRLT